MLNIIRQLRHHHAGLLDQLDDKAGAREPLRRELSALRLAEACLLKARLNEEQAAHPTQIAVLGPTQAGKSTLVNLLTGSSAAGVSALAGYTVHAHAYCFGTPCDGALWAERLFSDYRVVKGAQTDPDDYYQIGVNSVSGGLLDPHAPCVLWDTPDFDSVHAQGYRGAVLRTLALADVLVLIVSREKYADRSVWDLLELIAPLGKPMLVCINKLDAASMQAIPASFLKRYREVPGQPTPPQVIGMPFVRGLDASAAALPQEVQTALGEALSGCIKAVDRQQQVAGSYALMEQHWQAWTAPVTARHEAERQWQTLINSTLSGSLDQYQRDYLDNPDNYDAFKRTVAQLLLLLEIPGVASSLARARQAITWPARKLLSLGKQAVGEPSEAPDPHSMERSVLNNCAANALTTLLQQIEQKEQAGSELQAWWHALGRTVLEQRQALLRDFENAASQYQQNFESEINTAADNLYEQLRQQPAKLNTLRGARVAADAAAVGLALKTGGIGMSDFVLAPALVSVTSLLTEGALGRYVDRVKARLRTRQRDAVEHKLLRGYLAAALAKLAEDAVPQADATLDEATLQAAAQQLRAGHAG
ncbi:50S ribosome-binding GTPase [Granulosicoccaceae sp. 1_MG-2023]|nr:50S ribosome-binding GTPase [Granulosicoccaceae sp. 1_MG-2023]